MLLAVLPLVFAWRSLPSYFFCAAFPMFVLMVAKAHLSVQRRALPFVFDRSEQVAQSTPTPVGMPMALFFRSLPVAWPEREDDGQMVQRG